MTYKVLTGAAGLILAAGLMAQTNSDRERQLQTALRSPNPITDVSIMMDIKFVPLNKAENSVLVSTKISGSELALARESGHDRTMIDFIGQIQDEYGSTVANIRDHANISLTDGSAAQLSQRPIEYDTKFTLLPGTYTIKFLARDNETGRMGTYEQKFTIPRVTAAAAAPAQQDSGQLQLQQLRAQVSDLASAQAAGVGGVLAAAGGRGQMVTGSPFSAREERKTTQTLGDGTVIESSDNNLYYRDSQGRTRTEQINKEGATILIVDPVAGVRINLIPATRTAIRITMPTLNTFAFSPAPAAGGSRGGGGTGGAVYTDATLQARAAAELNAVATAPRSTTGSPSKTEDLGMTSQNGVMAQGTRTTLTIPQGQIGNNRDLHVVNERWYSKDLQMMVKTSNSDPRFGTTTYELTNISQTAPDPTLFQVPVGYTVTEQAGRGGVGRGGAIGGGR
jgi:hypothetical protein